MPTIEDVKNWRGETAHGTDGKLGKIEDVYLDEQTREPEWVAITTGLFGTKVSFAPLAEATHSGDGVKLPYSTEQVKSAPNAEADGQLSQEEEAALYKHYGLNYSEGPSDTGLPTGHEREPVGHDTSGPTTDDAMTRSEEELRVGKREVETGRVRLRKFIETEQVQTTVPIQREEVRVEREPITEGNVDDALDGPALSEEEHEVVLHEEQPVVEKNVVPKERVRLEKDTHVEEQTVSEEVRKERIEAEGDVR